jgi:hypothetical protein
MRPRAPPILAIQKSQNSLETMVKVSTDMRRGPKRLNDRHTEEYAEFWDEDGACPYWDRGAAIVEGVDKYENKKAGRTPTNENREERETVFVVGYESENDPMNPHRWSI